jgi:hypothetical protein
LFLLELLRKYRFLITILVTCQSVFALIPGASGTARPYNRNYFIDDQHISPSPNFELTDSLLAITAIDNNYIKPRYTKLILSGNGCDTIRKSSDINIERLNKNSLSTLKSKYENNFITRNLFSLIIKEYQPSKSQMAVNSTLYFAPFAGKRIGKIRIQQLDIFGPTFQDTLREASGWIEKSGNAIHMKTTEQKLRMQLLFNSGETVIPQLMADNEKIIRDLPYIQDVAIILSYPDKYSEIVDVLVIVKERFEYGISGNLSSNSSELEIIDQNMFGIGHQLSARMGYFRSETPHWGGSFNYIISDLGGKFIRTGLGYTNTFQRTGWNAFLEKQFITSKVDWAGGISLERIFSNHFLTPYSYTRLDTAASYLNSDIWFGRQLNNRNTYSPIGNIVVAARYLHQNYYNNAFEFIDNSYYRNHDFTLASIGISKRYLFKNNQVYGYGITEDIPYGRFAELAIGYDIATNRNRPYIHLRYSKAKILEGGAYFKWQVGIGGFLYNSQVEQGAIQLSTNYFTNYIYLNRHPYRFFVNMELLSGINRFKEEYLVINRRFGIRDFYSLDTKGTNRLKINIESVRFWGWNYSGFRFANYFFADAAFLSDDLRKILNDQFYGGIGLGIRVHNESLIFNVLELRLSWIPIAPKNFNPFILNAFGQPKARFDDFLGGKPQEILYQ